MQRPAGVTVIAILQFLGAAGLVLVGLLFMVGMGFLGTVIAKQGSSSGLPMGFLAGMGAVLGVVMLLGGALNALIGWGLWTLKNWARITTLAFTIFGAGLNALGVMSSLVHLHIFAVVWGAVWLGLHVLVIWYLMQPHVVQAFKGNVAVAASAGS